MSVYGPKQESDVLKRLRDAGAMLFFDLLRSASCAQALLEFPQLIDKAPHVRGGGDRGGSCGHGSLLSSSVSVSGRNY